MLLKQLREEVWKMNLELPKNHLVTMTSGNVSGRDPKTGYVVIKPSGVKYDVLKPQDMVVVDLKGNKIEGKFNPSIDTISHLVVYRNNPLINGIVHTHSPFATSFAVAGKSLPVLMTEHADEFGQSIPVARYASPIPLEDVGESLCEILKKNNVKAILLKNHGVFTFGDTPTDALKSAVRIEDIAKIYVFAFFLGNPKPIPKYEVKKWYKRYHEIYGQKK